jgi:hypothetical protein
MKKITADLQPPQRPAAANRGDREGANPPFVLKHGVALVPTNDFSASRIRIRTATNVMSLQKLFP